MQYIWLTYVDYTLIYVTRLPARSDLSLNAMSVKVLNPQCNKPTNILIWGIALAHIATRYSRTPARTCTASISHAL